MYKFISKLRRIAGQAAWTLISLDRGKIEGILLSMHVPTSIDIKGSQVRSLSSPPSSLPKPRKPSSIEKRPFLRGSCPLFSTFPVSADNNGLSGEFLASSLRIQKFRSWRLDFGTEL